MAKKRISVDCKAYLGTAPITAALPGGAAAASFVLLHDVKDVKINRGSKEADTSNRDSRFVLTQVALLDVSIDLVMLVGETPSSQLLALEAAYWAGTTVSAAFMRGDITTPDTDGVAGNWSVTKADEDQTLANADEISYTLKPVDEFTGHYTVAGS